MVLRKRFCRITLIFIFTSNICVVRPENLKCRVSQYNDSSQLTIPKINNACKVKIICDSSEKIFLIDWDKIRETDYSFYEKCIFSNKGKFIIIYKTNSDLRNMNEQIPFMENFNNLYDKYYSHIHQSNNYPNVEVLNLEDNNYYDVPLFRDLSNMHTLILRRNHLSTAKLFCKNRQLPSLKVLDLSQNDIASFENGNHNPFKYDRLLTLNISDNLLKEIPGGTFEGLDNLTRLDLSQNDLDRLDVMSFEGLKHLIYLNLSGNKLNALNLSLVRFSELEELYCDNNEIMTLKANELDKMVKIKTISFKSNKIVTIESNVFRHMISLENIYLNNNILISIPVEAFDGSISLQTVDLTSNLLTSLPLYLFKGKNIKVFHIEHNTIQGEISKGIFEGLQSIDELNLSSQNISVVLNYTFFGLNHLKNLNMSDNIINKLSPNCFKTLHNLIKLDLSNNQIITLDFDSSDLVTLEYLNVGNNLIAHVNFEHLGDMQSLKYFFLSNNQIKHLESKAFSSLRDLLIFQISDNPLSSVLEAYTFDGLASLPELDISHTQLSAIKNYSFNYMAMVEIINLTHNNIQELEYNSFSQSSSITKLDLSFNRLKVFSVNETHLAKLERLDLSNNFISKISFTTFKGLYSLAELIIFNNSLTFIEVNSFRDQTALQFLDLSANFDLVYDMKLINNLQILKKLFLSGVKHNIDFSILSNFTMRDLRLSNCNLNNTSLLNTNTENNLENLVLSHNKILKVEFGGISNFKSLMYLDLSYNKLNYIQPGAFKENNQLMILNVSHNFLSVINYGVFYGLLQLKTIDLSYNLVTSLNSERFDELHSLQNIIADSNKIEYIDREVFKNSGLETLSIGDNPLSCKNIYFLKNNRYKVTTLIVNKHSSNVWGITCYENDFYEKDVTQPSTIGLHNIGKLEKLLQDIKNILTHSSDTALTQNQRPNSDIKQKDQLLLMNLTKSIESGFHELKSDLKQDALLEINSTKESNNILKQILNALTILKQTVVTPVIDNDVKENSTKHNLLNYINSIRADFDLRLRDINENKKLVELEDKVESLSQKIESQLHENASKSVSVSHNEGIDVIRSSSIFTETCVGMILIILIAIVLYVFYKTNMFVTARHSTTRNIEESLVNASL